MTQVKETRLNYARLRGFAEDSTADYANAEPFPHIVIEDFLDEPVLHEILAALESAPKPDDRRNLEVTDARGDTVQKGKLGWNDILQMPLFVRHLFYELNAGPFLNVLKALTGIDGLISDPHLRGGGIHEYEPGAVLAVHADFNLHRELKLDRRLNLLLFLNESWKVEWGGALELWQPDMSHCARSVVPVANTCVVFSTTSNSYHGMPEPLKCPAGRSRRSLALYYYSNGRPEHEISDPGARAQPFATQWQRRPSDK